jgi:lysophospholipase L1-like esterase
MLTTHSTSRGKFACHPYLPFALNPAWPDNNSAGFRGAEIALRKKAGVRRVACVGASTTYGLLVTADEAYPAQLEKLLNARGGQWEVINAGVPGYVSTETLVNYLVRVMPYSPDVAVVLLGRNDVFPQTYNGFQPDYSHYRRVGFNYTVSNYWHKELFGWSHLTMLLCTVGGQRFGWSEQEEHPLYGGMVWENCPSAEQAEANVADSARFSTYQRSLESLVAASKAHGVEVVICTMAMLPDRDGGNELPDEPAMQALVARVVDRNNEISRSVGERFAVPVVETAVLSSRPELFGDGCHMTAEGYRVRAAMISDAVWSLFCSERPR